MGKLLATFAISLNPEKDGDIVKLLAKLPIGKKGPWIKLAIREKIARKVKGK